MAKSKTPPAEKPKSIQILEAKRTRRFIRIHYRKGDEDFKIRSNENPLPEFSQALDALVPIVISVCEVPKSWDTGLRVTGFSVGDLRDAKTVSIQAIKDVSLSGAVLEFTTPAALLSTPTTEGAITTPLAKSLVALVDEAIERAKEYALGQRAQGTLDIDEDADEDDDGEYSRDEPLLNRAPTVTEIIAETT